MAIYILNQLSHIEIYWCGRIINGLLFGKQTCLIKLFDFSFDIATTPYITRL